MVGSQDDDEGLPFKVPSLRTGVDHNIWWSVEWAAKHEEDEQQQQTQIEEDSNNTVPFHAAS